MWIQTFLPSKHNHDTVTRAESGPLGIGYPMATASRYTYAWPYNKKNDYVSTEAILPFYLHAIALRSGTVTCLSLFGLTGLITYKIH
jgi:hypothetical protein